MSDALYTAQSTAGRIAALERKVAEQAEQLRQKDEQIAELADVLARHGGRNPLVDSVDAAWHTEECWRGGRSSCTSLCRDTVAALAKAGRTP